MARCGFREFDEPRPTMSVEREDKNRKKEQKKIESEQEEEEEEEKPFVRCQTERRRVGQCCIRRATKAYGGCGSRRWDVGARCGSCDGTGGARRRE